MIRETEKRIEAILGFMDLARLGDYEAFKEMQHELIYLGIQGAEQYRKYKHMFHAIEAKKSEEFNREREKHKSDLATTKSLNRKYWQEIKDMELEEDIYEYIDMYYKRLDKYSEKLNSGFIRELAQEKRQQF